MKLAIHGGKDSLEVADSAFAADFNEPLVHQVVTAHRALARRGTKAQKTRAQVRGGGTKPWRQNGTGRARVGSIRNPIWVGGGRAFAASPRSHAQKVNRKMYRAAMRSILSELVRQDRLVVVEELACDEPRTRELVGRLKDLGVADALLLVVEYDENTCLAARNLPGVDILDLREVNPVSLVRYPTVVATAAAVKGLEERFS
jgi:large subunit ribosomal protein L4